MDNFCKVSLSAERSALNVVCFKWSAKWHRNRIIFPFDAIFYNFLRILKLFLLSFPPSEKVFFTFSLYFLLRQTSSQVIFRYCFNDNREKSSTIRTTPIALLVKLFCHIFFFFVRSVNRWKKKKKRNAKRMYMEIYNSHISKIWKDK